MRNWLIKLLGGYPRKDYIKNWEALIKSEAEVKRLRDKYEFDR
jgi:hypothetical protein